MLRFLIVLGAFALVLTACGGADDATRSDDEVSATVVEPLPSASVFARICAAGGCLQEVVPDDEWSWGARTRFTCGDTAQSVFVVNEMEPPAQSDEEGCKTSGEIEVTAVDGYAVSKRQTMTSLILWNDSCFGGPAGAQYDLARLYHLVQSDERGMPLRLAVWDVEVTADELLPAWQADGGVARPMIPCSAAP